MDKTELWGEAVIEYPSGINASVYRAQQADSCASVYALLFLIILLLSHKQIRRALSTVVLCCFRFLYALKIEENLSLEQGRNTLFGLSLFHFSMVTFHFVKASRAELFGRFEWLSIPLFFLLYLLFYLLRRAVFAFIGWIIRAPNELKFMAKGLRDFVIFAAVATFPLSFVHLFSWSSVVMPMAIWCVSALTVSFLLFVFRTFRYFIYVRFSVFFWILYLCTLEIAPLALLYRALITI